MTMKHVTSVHEGCKQQKSACFLFFGIIEKESFIHSFMQQGPVASNKRLVSRTRVRRPATHCALISHSLSRQAVGGAGQ